MGRVMKIWKPIILVLSALALLSGCSYVKLLTFGSKLGDAAAGYVEEVVRTRQEIRRDCAEMLTNEVRKLQQAGDYDEARELLAQAYPPLTILQAVDEGDASVIVKELNDARACTVRSKSNE